VNNSSFQFAVDGSPFAVKGEVRKPAVTFGKGGIDCVRDTLIFQNSRQAQAVFFGAGDCRFIAGIGVTPDS
jgi:hypothetical protein